MQKNLTDSRDVANLVFQLILSMLIVGACLSMLQGCQDVGLQPALCPNISRECGPGKTGECHSGIQLCDTSTGLWGACEGAFYGELESCDGLDNDCDGVTDNVEDGNICSPGTGDCGPNIWKCSDGAPICAPIGLPSEETCDGRDNDCDGDTDEGIVQACYSGPKGSLGVGNCAPGYTICGGGRWTACLGEVLPDTEVSCNALDEDCNGIADDTDACLCGQVPTQEKCDGIDNNCNGLVDEDVLNACGYCGPLEEVPCDLVDNDCDGLVDEDNPPPNDIIFALDTSGSMGTRVDTSRGQLQEAVGTLELLCTCNEYTVIKFPEPEGYYTEYIANGSATQAINALSLFTVGGGAFEPSLDVIVDYSTDTSFVVVIADEQGQSQRSLTEQAVAQVASDRVLVFSDEPTSYDEIGQTKLLNDGSTIASDTIGFITKDCE